MSARTKSRKEKLRPREVVLSLLGAATILASFVVKDVLQDATKEKVVRLEASNAAVNHNNDQDILLKTLDGIGDSICSLHQTESRAVCAKFFALPSSEYAAEWMTLSGTLYSLPAPPLWRDASQREKYKNRLQEFYASFQRLDKEEKDVADAKLKPTEGKSASEVHEDVTDFMIQAVTKTKHSTELAVEKMALTTELTELIESEKRQNEILYDSCKVASYCLFALGWGLALFGRLFHVPGLTAPD